MKNYKNLLIALLFIAGVSTACEDFLEPTLSDSKDTATALGTVDDLNAFMLGIMDDINSTQYLGSHMPVALAVRSDNFFANANSGRFTTVSQFSQTASDGYASDVWTISYQAIANANVVINAELEETVATKHIKGQAYALRALIYMNLNMFFGQEHVGGTLGVPIITVYNDGNLIPARNTVAEVWAQVEADLAAAATNMSQTAAMNNDKTLITYNAVKALQSRYFLYTKQYANAITAADAVINSGDYTVVDGANLLTAYAADGGQTNSIFELAYLPSNNPGNESIARFYLNTNYGDVELTLDAATNLYDAGDDRIALIDTNTHTSHGLQYRLTGKFPDAIANDDNVILVRYEEVILNKAEAQSRSSVAALTVANTLNLIANKRGIAPYIAPTTADVMKERRRELIGEGFRFFDLIRNGQKILRGDSQEPYPDATGIPAGDSRLVYPIPLSELNANSSMVQNEDYNSN